MISIQMLQVCDESIFFHERLESNQYNSALAMTGTIRGSSRETLYQELDFESLQQQR